MNDQFFSSTSNVELKKGTVWTEGSQIQAKEIVMPRKSSASTDDIPTLPDLDDFQDILEKDVSKPPLPDKKDTETVNTLAEVSGGIGTTLDGIEGVIEVLRSYIPTIEMDTTDSVWTVDTLLTQLAGDEKPT